MGQDASQGESGAVLKRLGWRCAPRDVIGAWPADRPLAGLVSGLESGAGPEGQAERRWTILASPVGEHVVTGGDGVLNGDGVKQGEIVPAALAGMQFGSMTERGDGEEPPFRGGWLLALKYELGEVIEPSVREGEAGSGEVGGVYLRCPGAVVYDHLLQQWWMVSERACFAESSKHPAQWFGATGPQPRAGGGVERAGGMHAGGMDASAQMPALRAKLTSEEYSDLVVRAKAHIEQGDIYQVNLTHQLTGAFGGSSRQLFLAMMQRAEPWFGAYFELGCDDAAGQAKGTTLLSISPELFLRAAASGEITTRPMKGTRPGGVSIFGDAARELASSEKEQAELTMIVDLMRNDLGRLCEAGSVHVSQARRIESHHGGTILQATAAITGRLRAGTSLEQIIAGTFPPGSITGAPKVSAMKIIRRLERAPRGYYCGAIGYCSSHGGNGEGKLGAMALSVAIRTLVVEGRRKAGRCDVFEAGATASYGVGAGIVADSEPESEWLETLEKAKIMGTEERQTEVVKGFTGLDVNFKNKRIAYEVKIRTDLIEVYVLRPRAPFTEGIGGFDVLQLKRAKAPLKETWQPIAGHVEVGESLAEAAIREASEEAGVVMDGSQAGVSLFALQGVHPYLMAESNQIVMTGRFVCVVEPNFEPKLNNESADSRWLWLASTTMSDWFWPGQIEAIKEIQQMFSTHPQRREHLQIDLLNVPSKPPPPRLVIKLDTTL